MNRAALPAESQRPSMPRLFVWGALVATMAIGLLLRLTGRNWDGLRNLHPDENIIVAASNAIQWPASIGQFFDSAASPLNIFNQSPVFPYGTFPLFLGKFLSQQTGAEARYTSALVFRSLEATADGLVIPLLFLIGRRLFGEKVGLLAALLYALCVLPIQLSHYVMFDPIASALCVLAFYLAIRAMDSTRWWWFLLTGIVCGLAIASKLNAIPVLGFLALPLFTALRESWGTISWNERVRSHARLFGLTLIGLLAAVVTFRIGQPYTFAGPGFFDLQFDPRWKQDFDHWAALRSGSQDVNSSVQWAHRTPVVFFLRNLMRWGLGPALGIAALAGLVLGCIRLLTASRLPSIWTLYLLGWPVFWVVFVGTSFAQPMRYALPAYPFLVLIAAALLVELGGRLREHWPRLPWIGIVPALIVVAPTALWALAFTSIYTRPPTLVDASAWVYNNVPAGTTLLTEHWDTPFPVRTQSAMSRDDYSVVQLPLYDNDTQAKLDYLIDQLEAGEYLVLESNRLYESIPRMPERWPMTTAYYQALFDGKLGFDLVETFTSYPSILGLSIDDSSAEESFTVFDHPKVMIFKKNDLFDAEAVRNLLTPYLQQDIVNVAIASSGYNLLMMTPAERETQTAGGTWSERFDRSSIANHHPAIFWYLALQLLALAAYPICRRVLYRLPDQGYAASKSFGMLSAAVIAWTLGSYHLVAFGRGSAWLSLAILASVSALVVRSRWRLLLTELRMRWRWIAMAETLFLTTYLIGIKIRSVYPDLWHPDRTGERPMDIAYFTAVLKSTNFPPYDPWYAGGYMNYYYFGWVVHAVPALLTGIIPTVAYNLGMATTFALLCLNAWAFVALVLAISPKRSALARAWSVPIAALLGPLFVAVIGNVDMARRLGSNVWTDYFEDPSGRPPVAQLWYIVRGVWRGVTQFPPTPLDAYIRPTRVISGTTDEFPAFSLLWGDFHPHIITAPFTILALIVALGVGASAAWPSTNAARHEAGFFGVAGGWRRWWSDLPKSALLDRIGLVFVGGMVTGALYPMNSWDYPTYTVIVMGSWLLVDCLGSIALGNHQQEAHWIFVYATARRAAISALAVAIAGRALFLPFYSHFLSLGNGFARWHQPSTAGQYLVIFGIALFVIVSYLTFDLATRVARPSLAIVGRSASPASTGFVSWVAVPTISAQIWPAVALLVFALLIGAALLGNSIMALLGALGILVLASGLANIRRPLPLFMLGLCAVAIVASAFVERYVLIGDNDRFNTVYKIHFQVWVLWGIVASVYGIWLLVRLWESQRRIASVSWGLLAAVLLVAGLMFPVFGGRARLADAPFGQMNTLDGAAFMLSGRPVATDLMMASDHHAILWMQDNIEGSPVVLEGLSDLYKWGWRISEFTGLPTVVGWDFVHEYRQRPGMEHLIDQRKADVQTMLGERRSFESIQPLLDKYHIEYIYIGELERQKYDPDALKKFQIAATNGLLEIVYDQDGVTIYRYRPADSASVA